MKLRSLLFAAAITLGSSVSAFAAEKDVVDTAIAAGQFETLAAALEAAGLSKGLVRSRSLLPPMKLSPSCRPVPSKAC